MSDEDFDQPEPKTRFVQVVFAERWRVDGRLGVGGMGNVLLATDLETQKLVALKTLGMQFVDKPEFVKRFEREGQLLSKLNHPNLPPFVAFSRHEGMPFFVMKYVEGTTLGALLKERERLGPLEAVRLLRQLADALEYLHARGVVHRDLKPDNLMIDADGRITLLDFGISAQSDATRLTLPGVAIGTPLYMAPELITTGQATVAADVYALGLLAYTMLAGQHPFANDDRAGMLTRQVMEVPRAADLVNPEVSPAVAAVLRRALEKDPDARFASASALVDALAQAAGLTPTDSTPDDAGPGTAPEPLPALSREPTQDAVNDADDEFAAVPTVFAPPDYRDVSTQFDRPTPALPPGAVAPPPVGRKPTHEGPARHAPTIDEAVLTSPTTPSLAGVRVRERPAARVKPWLEGAPDRPTTVAERDRQLWVVGAVVGGCLLLSAVLWWLLLG